jgi:hypothetical protein
MPYDDIGTARHGITSIAKAARMIEAGCLLLLAGDERALSQLPPGQWVGGTVAQFLTPAGCVPAKDQLLYTDFTSLAVSAELRHLDSAALHGIARHYPRNGFAVLIAPGFSPILLQLASEILDYQGLYDMPLTGWISAVDLNEIGIRTPKTFAGTPEGRADEAAIMYITLPDNAFAQLHIVNLFTPGKGPNIRVPKPGFQITGECLIGGQPRNLADYMAAESIDPRLPLIADRDGALLNISILKDDPQDGTVTLLSPVCPSLDYRFADSVLDYREEFIRAANTLGPAAQMTVSSICVLNALHAGLHKGHGLPITAPVTFGQIAYTVLNQTLTCLAVNRLEDLDEFCE